MASLSKSSSIIPAYSAGGISIGEPLSDIEMEVRQSGVSFTQGVFPNISGEYRYIEVKEYGVTSYALNQDMVSLIRCTPPYQGRYKDWLYPGITISELMANTTESLLTLGCIIPDGDFGIHVPYPLIFEEIDFVHIEEICHLPPYMRLNEIFIRERNWCQ